MAASSFIWAPSSEFVSSSIPSWQISTAHAQPFRGARTLAFCLKVPLDSLLVWASSEGSGETARMRRLARTFAARIGDKYQIRLTRSIYCWTLQTKHLSKLFIVVSQNTEEGDQVGCNYCLTNKIDIQYYMYLQTIYSISVLNKCMYDGKVNNSYQLRYTIVPQHV